MAAIAKETRSIRGGFTKFFEADGHNRRSDERDTQSSWPYRESSIYESLGLPGRLASIALQPPDIDSARLLKPVLELKLDPATYLSSSTPLLLASDRSKQISFRSSAKMQPEPSFLETRVIEPRIGLALL